MSSKDAGKCKLSYDELLTLVIGVESTLNERPLTYADSQYHNRNLPIGGKVVEVERKVTVAEKGVPRGKWRLGKVDLITGNDGETKEAKVMVLTKRGKPMYLNRPVQKLYPLEVGGPVETRQSQRAWNKYFRREFQGELRP